MFDMMTDPGTGTGVSQEKPKLETSKPLRIPSRLPCSSHRLPIAISAIPTSSIRCAPQRLAKRPLKEEATVPER